MRSRSTLRARSLYDDRINRNLPGLIPSNRENPSHTAQGGGSRPEASSIISSFFVSEMKIDFLLNVMMLIEIGHCRDVHDFILCHECGYINHLSDGLLNVLFLGRDRGVCTKSRRALTLDTPRSPPCSVVIQLSGMTSCST